MRRGATSGQITISSQLYQIFVARIFAGGSLFANAAHLGGWTRRHRHAAARQVEERPTADGEHWSSDSGGLRPSLSAGSIAARSGAEQRAELPRQAATEAHGRQCRRPSMARLGAGPPRRRERSVCRPRQSVDSAAGAPPRTTAPGCGRGARIIPVPPKTLFPSRRRHHRL
jgi:hypothetical protein